jgi:uncharacterized membrane protein
MTGKAALFASRTIEVLLVLLGIGLFVGDSDMFILVWDLLAVVYLWIRVVRMRRSRAGRSEWLAHGVGGRFGLVFTIFASLVGIGAGLGIVMSESDAEKAFSALVGVPGVLLAWAILHFGYAERYARTYYADAAERPLAFPNTDTPTFVEFAYFSFTLGTTFSVSDVETRTSAIRSQILAHSILAFIYNTATIGIAVSVITG